MTTPTRAERQAMADTVASLVLLFLVCGWVVMLALGVLHAHDVPVPALGYGETVLVLVAGHTGRVAVASKRR